MKYIIDSYAWVEYFTGSEKGKILKNLFFDERNKFYIVECCLAEIRGWSIKNNRDFNELFAIIKANSEILKLSEDDWILAGEERAEQRKKQKNFGLIDSTILIKQKEMCCKIITGDQHFAKNKEVIFLK